MPKSWINDQVTIEGATMSAQGWLEHLKAQGTMTAQEIADALTEAGWPTTKKGVDLKSGHLGLKKGQGETPAEPPLDIGEIAIHARGNALNIRATTEGGKTERELMTEAGLNPQDWIIKGFEVRQRNVLSAQEHKDLEAENGRWSGTVQKDSGTKVLWSYVLKIVPLIAEAQQVHLVPIRAHGERTQVTNVAPDSAEIQKALVFADTQIGFSGNTTYHDRDVLDLLVKVAQNEQPNTIVCLGDYLDLDQWQDRFLKDPAAIHQSQRSLAEGHYWLAKLREACPFARIVVIEGNHDKRARVAVSTHLSEAHGLHRINDPSPWPVMSLAYLMDFEALDIEYKVGYPKNDLWLSNHIRLAHGENFSATPGATARAVIKNAAVHTIVGHSHVGEVVSKTFHMRKEVIDLLAVAVGCCCKIDGTVPGKSGQPQWQQGFGVLHYHPQRPSLAGWDDIRVRNGTMLYKDAVYHGQSDDRLADLATTFPNLF